MKKLTAGIFTVLMGLVSVNAADAAVASKGYVDKLDRVQAEKIGNATFTEDTLNYIKGEANLTAAVKKLDAAVTDASGDLSNVYTKTDADAKFIDTDEITGYATDAELTAVSDVANAADTLSKANEGAITVLNGDESTVGSVAEKIKNATTTVTTEYKAADTVTLNSAKDYTDTEIAKINSADDGILKQAKDYTDAEVKELADGAVATNTAAIAAINNDTTGVLATAKKYADDQDTAQTTAITTAYQAADTATLNSAKTYTDQKVAGLNLAEISRVPAACGTPGNYCTLTTNGTNFVWEVIARGDAADEEEPSDVEGSDRLKVTVPGVTEPAVTQ